MTGKNSSEVKNKGRCLALFPGAFRPPHQAHFATVLNLVSRPDIDEVIIIITNRCRHIPGTSKVLEPEVAKKIWSIYLQDTIKVRVEIAPYSAVKHAQSYFERVNENDTLVFCAGDSELRQGHGRFNKISNLSDKYNITASVIASPVPDTLGGATAVRANLAKGHLGRGAFITALPKHLNADQCEQVWRICRQSMREIHDITKNKIRKIIERQNLGEIDAIHSTKKAKPDAVYCVQLKTGKRLFVKYANDTVKAAALGQPLSLKPRKRIYAERRALKWISHNGYNLKFPEVICFENISKTLVLSEVCPGGYFLEEDIKQGVFDTQIIDRLSVFLALCHRTPVNAHAFWGGVDADFQHWQTLLELRTLGLQNDSLPIHINQSLEDLKYKSKAATQRGFFHLDFCPKNIRLLDKEIGVIDFEFSSSIGDPACDFGFLLGHYLFWGVVTDSVSECLQALLAAIHAYREQVNYSWSTISSRVLEFTGAAIIHSLNLNQQPRQITMLLLSIAAELLVNKLDSIEEIDLSFHQLLKSVG